MKLAQMQRGTRAEKPTTVPVGETRVPALLRPLSAYEETEVIAEATKFAKEKGVEAKDGNAVYDSALYAHTLLRATLDADSPAGARERFYPDAGAILQEYDSDTLAMLHEEQQLWQEECSPSIRSKSFGDMLALTRDLASSDGAFFFIRLSPRTRLNWALTSARLLASSPELRSLLSSDSASPGPQS